MQPAGAVLPRMNGEVRVGPVRLYTNEYEGDRSGDVVIVVDARRESFIGTETDNPIEHGVRAALGIAEHVLASKNRVGLIVQREVPIGCRPRSDGSNSIGSWTT